jgi:hypothetical protein
VSNFDTRVSRPDRGVVFEPHDGGFRRCTALILPFLLSAYGDLRAMPALHVTYAISAIVRGGFPP